MSAVRFVLHHVNCRHCAAPIEVKLPSDGRPEADFGAILKQIQDLAAAAHDCPRKPKGGAPEVA